MPDPTTGAGEEDLGAIPVDLVDEHGTVFGQSDKRTVHQPPGLLHRAVSVVLVRGNGDVLLQRRALSKYHFGGWWANACCSHPLPGEPAVTAAARCLRRELGVTLDVAELEPRGSFVYQARDPSSGLVEHERDEVFLGRTDDEPHPDPAEIAELRWCPRSALPSAASRHQPFAPWAVTALALALDPI
jgi:isopentenyl-diphosphate delta-isomerase